MPPQKIKIRWAIVGGSRPEVEYKSFRELAEDYQERVSNEVCSLCGNHRTAGFVSMGNRWQVCEQYPISLAERREREEVWERVNSQQYAV